MNNTCFLIKKILSIFLTIILSFSFIKAQSTQTPPPAPASMEEMFKNVDFEKMLQELEEIFGSELETEKETGKAPAKETTLTKQAEAKPIIQKEGKKETLEESFKNPAKPEKEEKVVKKLPKEKLDAFDFYIENFSRQLKELEVKISSFALGIAFKEKLEEISFPEQMVQMPKEEKEETTPEQQVQKAPKMLKGYKSIVESIIKNLAIIEGRKPHPKRKMYKKVFFLPMFTDLREQIMKTIKELENINNQITNLEKMSEEEKEKEEIEKLKALAEKKPITKTKIPAKLQNEIESVFQDLKNIAIKLEAVASSNQAKALVEEKKKKMEQKIKEAEERKKRAAGRDKGWNRQPSGGQRPYYPRDGRDRWPGEDSWYPGSGTTPSAVTTDKEAKPSETKPEEKKPEAKKKEKSKKEEEKETLDTQTKNTIDLINGVIKQYRPNDDSTLDAILDSNSLSRISQNLDEISKMKMRLEESDKKAAEKTEKKDTTKITARTRGGISAPKKATEKTSPKESKQLDDALKRFTPICVRLAKHYSGDEEQKQAAGKIFKEIKAGNLQEQATTELKKYEKEILKKLDHKKVLDDLKSYNPEKDSLDHVLHNLTILKNWPQSDKDAIEKITTKLLPNVKDGEKNIKAFQEKIDFILSTVEEDTRSFAKTFGNIKAITRNIRRDQNPLLNQLWKKQFNKELKATNKELAKKAELGKADINKVNQSIQEIKDRLTLQNQKLKKIKTLIGAPEQKEPEKPKAEEEDKSFGLSKLFEEEPEKEAAQKPEVKTPEKPETKVAEEQAPQAQPAAKPDYNEPTEAGE